MGRPRKYHHETGEELQAPAPKRRSRADEIRAARRERGVVAGDQRRLHVPDELKEEGYEYHWLNDDDRGRIASMTRVERGWETVKSDDIPSHLDADTVSRQVGVRKDGRPLMSYLARKPKEICDEDRAAKARQRDDLARGRLHMDKESGEETELQDGISGYVADGHTLRDGRRGS